MSNSCGCFCVPAVSTSMAAMRAAACASHCPCILRQSLLSVKCVSVHARHSILQPAHVLMQDAAATHSYMAAAGGAEPQRLMYFYYTAGTGGVGPTILDTTFLLAGEPVRAYDNGRAVTMPPVSGRRVADYGKGLGKKGVHRHSFATPQEALVVCAGFMCCRSCNTMKHGRLCNVSAVARCCIWCSVRQAHAPISRLCSQVTSATAGMWLYNLPEVRTGAEVLRIPTVSARFGTSPFFWNWCVPAAAASRLAAACVCAPDALSRLGSCFVSCISCGPSVLAGCCEVGRPVWGCVASQKQYHSMERGHESRTMAMHERHVAWRMR